MLAICRATNKPPSPYLFLTRSGWFSTLHPRFDLHLNSFIHLKRKRIWDGREEKWLERREEARPIWKGGSKFWVRGGGDKNSEGAWSFRTTHHCHRKTALKEEKTTNWKWAWQWSESSSCMFLSPSWLTDSTAHSPILLNCVRKGLWRGLSPWLTEGGRRTTASSGVI